MKTNDVYLSSNIHFLETRKTRSQAYTNIEGYLVFLKEVDPNMIGEEFHVKINSIKGRIVWGEVLIEEPEDTHEDESDSDDESDILKDKTNKDTLAKQSKLKYFEDVDESEVDAVQPLSSAKAKAAPIVRPPARDDPFIKKYKPYVEQAMKTKSPEEIIEIFIETYPSKKDLILRYMWEEYGVGEQPPEPTQEKQPHKSSPPSEEDVRKDDYEDDNWDEDTSDDYEPETDEEDEPRRKEDNGRTREGFDED